jgi:hypothetical protein
MERTDGVWQSGRGGSACGRPTRRSCQDPRRRIVTPVTNRGDVPKCAPSFARNPCSDGMTPAEREGFEPDKIRADAGVLWLRVVSRPSGYITWSSLRRWKRRWRRSTERWTSWCSGTAGLTRSPTRGLLESEFHELRQRGFRTLFADRDARRHACRTRQLSAGRRRRRSVTTDRARMTGKISSRPSNICTMATARAKAGRLR